MKAHVNAVEKPFSNSHAACAQLLERLGGSEMAVLEHGEVERRLWGEGLELLRIMYEDHMNLRAQAVPTEPVVGSEGETRTHRRAMPRKLMSIFGPIVIHTREGFRAPGLDILCPVDAALNLPPTLDSHNVRRRVAALSSMHSFDVVGQQIENTTGARVGKRQFEAIAQFVSRDFDEFYETAMAAPVDAKATLLIGGVDGTGVSMLPDARVRPPDRILPAPQTCGAPPSAQPDREAFQAAGISEGKSAGPFRASLGSTSARYSTAFTSAIRQQPKIV